MTLYTSSPKNPPSLAMLSRGAGPNHSGDAPSRLYNVFALHTVTAPVPRARITAPSDHQLLSLSQKADRWSAAMGNRYVRRNRWCVCDENRWYACDGNRWYVFDGNRWCMWKGNKKAPKPTCYVQTEDDGTNIWYMHNNYVITFGMWKKHFSVRVEIRGYMFIVNNVRINIQT